MKDSSIQSEPLMRPRNSYCCPRSSTMKYLDLNRSKWGFAFKCAWLSLSVYLGCLCAHDKTVNDLYGNALWRLRKTHRYLTRARWTAYDRRRKLEMARREKEDRERRAREEHDTWWRCISLWKSSVAVELYSKTLLQDSTRKLPSKMKHIKPLHNKS